MGFQDRHDAGRQLADLLTVKRWHQPVVLGLVRGGIDVAAPVARALRAPLDVCVVRKIGAPGHPEFGVGAVTPDGPPIYDPMILRQLGLTDVDLEDRCEAERAEARRRRDLYRRVAPAVDLAGREVLVIDDGIATGVSARTALRSVRQAGPRCVMLAAPVCAGDVGVALGDEADQIRCLHRPEDLRAVGRWYLNFEQLSDADVVAQLRRVRGTVEHGNTEHETAEQETGQRPASASGTSLAT